MAAPGKATLTCGDKIHWSGGQPFNGYVLLIMALPSVGGAQWTRVCLKDSHPKVRVPTRVKVPIREGVYDPLTRIWRTDSLVPPNVRYSAFFYDDTDRLIAVGPELFEVKTAEYELVPPVLADPGPATVSPQPEDVPGTGVVRVVYGVPHREPVQGKKNGVNTRFTISRSQYSLVFVIWNQTVLTEGVHYTIAGNEITMSEQFIPDPKDTLEAVIW